MHVHSNKRNNQNKQKPESQYSYQNPHINYMYVHPHFRSTRTMSKTQVIIENFLQHQTEEYQRHYLTKQRIARALEHQKNIRLFRTIPKHFLPAKTPELPVDDPSLSAEFYRNYETLFFQHLDKTIIHNTITLELEDARLRQAVLNTEQQLAAITEPPTAIAHHHQQFLSQNNIPDHEVHPDLRRILPTYGTCTPNTTTKNTTPLAQQHTTNFSANPQKQRKTRKRRAYRHPTTKKHPKIAQTPSHSPAHSFLHPLPHYSNMLCRLLSPLLFFFIPALPRKPPDLTLHNLSTYELTPQDIQLLNKGLSFAPTPHATNPDSHQQLLRNFNDFARSLRLKYMRAKHTKQKQHYNAPPQTTTSFIYRRMKFLPPIKAETPVQRYTGVQHLEQYIEDTKQELANNLPTIYENNKSNLPQSLKTALRKLRHSRQTVTIKPADKNLGIVLLNTEDYITQCLVHLTDSKTYRQTTQYPSDTIRRQTTKVVAAYKSTLETFSKPLYKFLQNTPHPVRIPQFYGLPKIHKKYTRLPPMRPIVSQTMSNQRLRTSYSPILYYLSSPA